MWQPFGRFKKGDCSRIRELLSGYVDRRLGTEELASVEEHLQACRVCREELKSLQATVAMLHRLPEVTPRRTFKVAPVRPLPYRWAIPALRLATVAAVVLLAGAFTVDKTDVLEKKDDLGMSYGAFVGGEEASGGDVFWTVDGLKAAFDPVTESVENTTVTLVVPDGSDNVVNAVNSLADNGTVYGCFATVSPDAPQVVLKASTAGASIDCPVTEFRLYSATADNESGSVHFNTNNSGRLDGGFAAQSMVAVDELNGSLLNMVPVTTSGAAVTDSNVLYSFDLTEAQREVMAGREYDWLVALEYGLLGLAAVLGGTAAVLWLRQRRARALEAVKRGL